MKAYLVDAKARQISEFDYDDYRGLQKHLPGGLCLGWVFHEHNGDVLYVDDEGLLSPPVAAFRVKDREDGQPMMSNGVLTGRDHHEIVDDDLIETTLDPTMTMVDLLERIEWLTVEEAMRWFREHSSEPAVVVTSDGDSTVLATWESFIEHMGQKEPAWLERALVACAHNRTQFGTILMAAAGRTPDDPPRFASRATVTSDGFVMCDFVDHQGQPRMGAFVGSAEELMLNAQKLSAHLKLNETEAKELDSMIRGWIVLDLSGRIHPAGTQR